MRLLVAFMVFAASLFPASAWSDNHSDNLIRAEIAAYQLSSAFSAFVFFEGAPRFSKELRRARQQGDQMMQIISERYPQIQQQWQQASGFTAEKEDTVFDGADMRLEIGLSVYQNELYRQINLAKQQSELIASNYLQARLKLEKILAQYMYSAVSAGAYNSENNIDEDAQLLSEMITRLPDHASLRNKLTRKWSFIKTKVLATKEQVAPFLTLHTANDIRKLLAAMQQG